MRRLLQNPGTVTLRFNTYPSNSRYNICAEDAVHSSESMKRKKHRPEMAVILIHGGMLLMRKARVMMSKSMCVRDTAVRVLASIY
jgi:hypothetical protein